MISLSRATAEDDAALRALLRDNPMPSWVRMSVAREPSYFAGCDRFGRDWAVVAHEGNALVGMYACSRQPVHMNGEPIGIGYLGSLRVDPRYRHRLRILRAGFDSVRRLSPPPPPEHWYTAIAAGNRPARRLLEANLRGMPRYRPCNELVSLALPGARYRSHSLWRPVAPTELTALCDLHNRSAGQYQFAPALTPGMALATGATFYAIDGSRGLAACMALWRQQAYKQVTAYGYRAPLEHVLPLYNAYARLTQRVALPPVGRALDQTNLAFLAVADGCRHGPAVLIEDALALAGSPVLTLGLHERHPWLGTLMRTFRPLTYRTRIYVVSFAASPDLDGRPAQPEAAVL